MSSRSELLVQELRVRTACQCAAKQALGQFWHTQTLQTIGTGKGVRSQWAQTSKWWMHDVYLGNFQQMCAYMTWAEDNFLWTHIPSYDWAWVLEDNFVVSSPSFHHVGPRDQAQVIKLGSKYLYLLIYLNAHPHHTHICFFFFFETVSHWLRTC